MEYLLQLRDMISPALARMNTNAVRNFRDVRSQVTSTQSAMQTLERRHTINIDSSQIQSANRQVQELRNNMGRVQAGGNSSVSSGMSGFSGSGIASMIMPYAGPIGAAVAAFATIKGAVSAAMDREQESISFEVLAGSKQRGDALLSNINQMAAATPFESADLIRATQTMLGFGVAQEKVLPIMKQLGDVSGGNKDRFQSLALAYSQVQSAGRLQGQDLMQMVNAGFNPLQQIATDTHRTMAQVRKDMEHGAISAEMVTTAIEHATSQGGRYFGMMDKQSQTTAGKLSTLRDNAHEASVALGHRMMPFVNGVSDALSRMTGTVRDWLAEPVGKEYDNQIIKLRTLQMELHETNTSEKRRKDILQELKDINGDTVKGINNEAIAFDKLDSNINKVISSLIQKKVVALEDVKADKLRTNVAELKLAKQESLERLRERSVAISPSLATANMSTQQKVASAEWTAAKAIKGQEWGAAMNGGPGGIGYMLQDLRNEIHNYNNLSGKINSMLPQVYKSEMKLAADRRALEKMYGVKPEDKTGTLKDSNSSSINYASANSTADSLAGGGGKIINIHIGKFQDSINIHTSNLNGGIDDVEKRMTEMLLRITNSANQAQN